MRIPFNNMVGVSGGLGEGLCAAWPPVISWGWLLMDESRFELKLHGIRRAGKRIPTH